MKTEAILSTRAKKVAATALRTCPSCGIGHLHEGSRERVFHPNGKKLAVPLLTSVCDSCHAEATTSSQHDENLRRLAARKAHYGELLMGEEILALRRRYGLTQQLASRIFGKGKIAFSRYESETTYPDDSTTRLITMAIEKPDTLKWLADQEGVEIPLWKERCEDRQRVTVRLLPKVFGAATLASTRRKHYVPNAGSARLDHSTIGIWPKQLSTTHQTLTVPDASNDERIEREAIAS